MKLRYETGIAALMQMLVITALSFLNGIVSMVSNCSGATAFSCATDVGIDLIYVILVAVWFGFVSALAYAAQDKRDHRLAFILIAAELMVLFVALFINARHYNDLLGLFTSLIDSAFAVWIIYLAINLIRAKGGRITGRVASRPRQSSVAKQSGGAKSKS